MADYSTPYTINGFAEGFERGLRIVNDRKDRLAREEESAYQRSRQVRQDQMAEEKFGLDKEFTGLQMEETRRKAKLDPTPEEAAEDRKLNRTAAGLNIATASYNLGRKKKDDTISDQEKIYLAGDKIRAGLPQLYANDPQFGKSAQALYGSIRSREILRNPQMYQMGVDWFSKAYKDVINTGINEVIGDSTADEQGVQKGSKIVEKTLRALDIDEKTGDIALILNVKVEQPDGTVKTYNAPYTKNRSDKPDDEVLLLTVNDFENVFKAGSAIEMGLQQAEKQGIPRQEALRLVEGQQILKKKEAEEKRVSSGFKPSSEESATRTLADTKFKHIKDPDERYAAAWDYRKRTMTGDKFSARVDKVMENSPTEITREQAIEIVLRDADSQFNPEAESKATKRIVYDRAGNIVSQ